MKTTTIICDACGADLTQTGNCVDYRLHLAVQGIPNTSGFATLMHIDPPMDGNKDFCGTRCLTKWLEAFNLVVG